MSVHVAPSAAISATYCDTCGDDPCTYPPFCRTCRAADTFVAPPKPTKVGDLICLAERARQLADLWIAGAMSKIEAVDRAYNFAVALGLCRDSGNSDDFASAKHGRPRKFDDDTAQRSSPPHSPRTSPMIEQPLDEADIQQAERIARGGSRHEKANGAGSEKARQRFELTRFNAVLLSSSAAVFSKGADPARWSNGAWGPPKCGKSFWTFDVAMHVTLGEPYRGRRVKQGVVVYLALEGGNGFRARIEAYRRQHALTDAQFFLVTNALTSSKITPR